MSRPVEGVDTGLGNRRAVVCGAGALDAEIGNGRATALLLARCGASVLCVDRDGERAETTARMIREEGGVATGVRADVSDPQECATLPRRVTERLGGSTFS